MAQHMGNMLQQGLCQLVLLSGQGICMASQSAWAVRMISMWLNTTHGMVQMLSTYTGTPGKAYSTWRCTCISDSSCTVQLGFCTHCAGHGLAMLQPLCWPVALPAFLHVPVQDQPDSLQHAQSLPAACNIQGHLDLSARQGGRYLCWAYPSVNAKNTGFDKIQSKGMDTRNTADLVFARQCRDLEDAEVSAGGDNPVWHGRQSKDERLADAAESRLLGLAARPSAAAHSTQQDLEPRHHQPISYARRRVQVWQCCIACMVDEPEKQVTK